MKIRIALVTTLSLSLCVANSWAFPSIPGYLKEAYKDDEAYKPFLETFEALKSKCDVCHKPGADKKARGHGLNDFGKAYHDVFKHKEYSKAHEDKNSAEALKLFKEAWEKAVKEKNADGKEFIELIKAGKLPGKND